MPRYIITKSQLHDVVYKFLDDEFKNPNIRKKNNKYSDNTFDFHLSKEKESKVLLSYYYYGPGTYDDDYDTEHFGVGFLSVDGKLADNIRKMFSLRESKVLDLIADWVSEKFNVDIDEVSIVPRDIPPVY
jgi:hypothetical protein